MMRSRKLVQGLEVITTELFHFRFCVVRGYWRQGADERLGSSPQRIQEPLVVRDRDVRPQEDP